MDDRPQTLQRVQEVSEFGPFVVVLTHFRCGAGCCRKVAGVEVGGVIFAICKQVCSCRIALLVQNASVYAKSSSTLEVVHVVHRMLQRSGALSKHMHWSFHRLLFPCWHNFVI